MTIRPKDIAAAVAPCGLILRGGFHPRPDDDVPPLSDDASARTVVLLGNAGPAMWEAFARSRVCAAGGPDALDRWTAEVVGELAATFGAVPVFPFDGPPYRPFQRWAQRAEPVAPSPLGILIHPDYGLWHAYRAALLFAGRLDLPPPDTRPVPCETCTQRPCLTTCPVGAFRPDGYDVTACAGFLATPAGADCLDLGCRARRACPAGAAYRYRPAQARWHMAAFRAAHATDPETEASAS